MYVKSVVDGNDEIGTSAVRSKKKIFPKTYNSGDSLVVTHLGTNPPVQCLYMAERTGSLILIVLWSYVEDWVMESNMYRMRGSGREQPN
jgi:hypothetical protein